MLYKYGKNARDFLGRFHFYFSLVFYILGGVFIKTIIALMLVGYEMSIASLYPTRAGEIIVKDQVGKLYAGAGILQWAVAEHFKKYISWSRDQAYFYTVIVSWNLYFGCLIL